MSEVLCEGGLVLCDGPRWHAGKLWFSDLYGGTVHTLTLDGHRETVLSVDGGPSGLAFLDDGRWLVASQRGQQILAVDPSGDVTVYADLAGIALGDVNDVVLHPAGHLYVGCYGFDIGAGEPFRAAPLMRVDPDGSVSVAAEGLSFPNGLVLDDTGSILLVAETEGRDVVAFDVAPGGDLSNRRVWADLGSARPDGMCLDAEGAVWVGTIESREYLRVAEGGEVLDRIDAGNQWAIAPMLGGPERRHLFQLNSVPVDPDDLKGAFVARIEVREVAVPGAGRP